MTDRRASKIRPTTRMQNMVRYVIMKFNTSMMMVSDIVSHVTPSVLSLLLSMAKRKKGRL